MSNRFTISLDKLRFCFIICANISSFTRLIKSSKDFSHNRGRNVVHDRTDQYFLKIAGKKTRMHLRRFAGDLDIFFEVFWKHTYSVSQLDVKDHPVVIDIGANIGMSAAWFYSCFPYAGIYCVEPDPENFKLMEANLNGLIPKGQLHFLNAAVGERDGRGEPVSSRYSYNKRVVENEEGKVSILSMASILEYFQLTQVDLLKIDVEGDEEAVLQDPAWLKKIRYLFIEFHSDLGLNNGLAKLEEAGFRWKKCPGNEMLIFAENSIF